MLDRRLRSQRLGCYLVAAALVWNPASAAAQMLDGEESLATSSRPGILATVLHSVDHTPPQSPRAPQRDSLKNGARTMPASRDAAMRTTGARQVRLRRALPSQTEFRA